MTHEKLAAEVAKRLGWPEEKTARIIGAIQEVICTELKTNNPVAIDDFGTLKTDICPEYILVVPETNERFLMPPSVEVILNSLFQVDKDNPLLLPDFTADEMMYNELNSSFSQFEPTLLNEGVQFPGIPEIVADEEDKDKESEVLENPHLQEEENFSPEFLDLTEKENEEPEYTQPQEEKTLSLEITVQQGDSQCVEGLGGQPDFSATRKSLPRPRSGRRSHNGKKTTPFWIPIAGGIAIIVASLFFKSDSNK